MPVQFIGMAMSGTYIIIALGALFIVLIALFLYYRKEAREIDQARTHRPLPGKFFIFTLLVCTFLGMIITEWQGVCQLSPWGFITGIVLGTSAEIMVYLHRKGKERTGPV
jgi:cell division protein FtsX